MVFDLLLYSLAEIESDNVAGRIITYPKQIFDYLEYLSNQGTSAQRWVTFACCTAVSLFVAFLCDFIIRKCLKRFAEKTENTYDDAIIDALEFPIVSGLTVTGMYFSTAILVPGNVTASFIHRCYLAVIACIVISVLLKIIKIASTGCREIAKKTGNTYSELLINLLSPLCKTAVWIAGALFIFDNVFNFNIGSLLAGAGIAAMAVAFAAQNTIANIFGALALIMDRPFKIGDRIQIDSKDGIVESIGLRSTSIRALDGTLWSIPNKTMTDSSILNFSTRPNFKYCFVINLTYNHTSDQLRKGKEMLHKLLDNHPLFDMEKQPPRITFAEMGDYSLDLQALCWFQTTDFMEFTRAKEELNFKILDALKENGLEMAYPTQSICLENKTNTPDMPAEPEK